ncbi:hypothetical protein AX17_006896 [Amanita inopinata Kibby_2008]|nr:hypothetical protein AX17_006896 [Amanita inopinata Kibby_2008]
MAKPATVKSIFADAQVFEVDSLTGFMAPHVPPVRLPKRWEVWEEAFDDAANKTRIQIWDLPGLTEEDKARSEAWRARVRQLPVLSIEPMKESAMLLRRAHLILACIQHFYLQSLPPDAPTIIPRPIALPLLRVSTCLRVPPLLTYSDTVLYNWEFKCPAEGVTLTPTVDNIRIKTLFTDLIDEEEFYSCSARIELRGVEALELMRVIMDEMFIGDDIAVRRTTGYLNKMAAVVDDLKRLLLDVQKLCDPNKYYNSVRPWFRGEDSDVNKRKWVFEGIEDDPELDVPTELSGPSAGQSSIVHVLDVFLGIEHPSPSPDKPSFMTRMKTYMPHNHRLFIDHLSSNPRRLRSFVLSQGDPALSASYNRVVQALKEFRDAHMIIATLYILGPARRAAKLAAQNATQESGKREPVKGTGGTDLVHFLKDTRARTSNALLSKTE